jgi:hypothetical protein
MSETEIDFLLRIQQLLMTSTENPTGIKKFVLDNKEIIRLLQITYPILLAEPQLIRIDIGQAGSKIKIFGIIIIFKICFL